MELKNRVAIVTGAGTSLGAAIAATLHDIGLRLVLTDGDELILNRLAKEFKHSIIVNDAGPDSTFPKKLINSALAAFGACDVVINSPTISRPEIAYEANSSEPSAMTLLNIDSMLNIAGATVKHFKAVKYGILINISGEFAVKTAYGSEADADVTNKISEYSEYLRRELVDTPIQVSSIEFRTVAPEPRDHVKDQNEYAANVLNPTLIKEIARSVRFTLEQPEDILIARLLIISSCHIPNSSKE